MTSGKRSSRIVHTYELDSQPYADLVNRTGQLADKTLDHYGEPTMSLSELRATLDRELQGVSLSEVIIKEREKGW